MAIYRNGELFKWGWGKYNPIDSVHRFNIGAGAGISGFYDGMIDEFRVWNAELDGETIKEWMNKSVDASHPYYQNMVAYYKFDEGNGFTVTDEITGDVGYLRGYPEWKDFNGFERVLNFTQQNFRPQMMFESGVYDPAAMDSLFMVDTIAKGPLMVTLFEDTLHANIPTDTITVWPTYYDNYVYSGGATDSSLVTPDGTLIKVEHPYYGAPYEILVNHELGRFITPYGNGLSLGDGWTWIYDVSDFRQLLYDSVHLTAGNFQELLDLKFMMIEGTPAREVVSIEKMWNGYWPLNNFENKVPPMTVALNPDAESYKLKITTSGHEWDNATNCAEFCQKDHWVDVDGVTEYVWEIIDECSDNPLYPQGGTWISDRAGWCPGAKVTEQHIKIEPTQADSVTLDYNCESDPYGRYSVSSFFVQYGPKNFVNDVAITNIDAPNAENLMLRINPVCGKPVIEVQNNGSKSLASFNIEYGFEGSQLQTRQWTGRLDFLEKASVILDPIDWSNYQNGNNTFIAIVSNPNGEDDEYEFNNTKTSQFTLAPEYPNEIVVELLTNKVGWHNNWEILDADGNVVVERDGFASETLYLDTLLLDDGCYTFKLYDAGDDGLSYWANNYGHGYLRFRDMDNSVIYNPDSDFGKFVYQDFTVGLAVSTHDLEIKDYIDVYPNPARNSLNLSFALTDDQNVSVELFDLTGKAVYSEDLGMVNNLIHNVNVANLPEGMYICVIRTARELMTRKIVIAR